MWEIALKRRNYLELETDKVNVEVVSEEEGVLQEQLASEGDTVKLASYRNCWRR